MQGKQKEQKEQTAPVVEYGLTLQQIEAAQRLAAGDSITSLASSLAVSRATLYRWQELPVFYCYVNKLRAEARAMAENSLFSLVSDATKTLRGCLNSPNDATRLNAAKYILDTVAKMNAGETDTIAEITRQHTEPIADFSNFENVDYVAIEKDLKKYHLVS